MADLPPDADQPSLKALGKRRLVDGDAPSPPAAPAPAPAVAGPAAKKVKASEDGEKRVTRSSLGGPGDRTKADSKDEDLTAAAPASTEATPSGSTSPPPPAPPAPTDAVPVVAPTPQFRALGLEDSFSRSRHGGPSEQQVDTSDAHYLRLHRFPEVLEKRSARLERDRLIHERSKLILEIEEMRGRGWVYQGMQGGKGEQLRRRKLNEGEERLKRYDELLPNQPRKSGMLNLGSHLASAASLADPPASSKSRSHSPLLLQPQRARHSTPLSASGDGGTTIRIRFGAATTTSASSSKAPARFSGRGPARDSSGARAHYAEDDDEPEVDYDDDDEEPLEDTNDEPYRQGQLDRVNPLTGSTKPKRDRTAERGRAAERIRLHLPPRVDISKAATNSHSSSTKKRARRRASATQPSRKRTRNVEMGRDSDFESQQATEEDEDDDLDEEGQWTPVVGNVAQLLAAEGHDITKSAVSAAAHLAARRLRLRDSFFSSEALRDAVVPIEGNQIGRRSSGRVAYAFGQRAPDHALARQFEFEPRGGNEDGADETVSPSLEELVSRRRRDGGHGEDEQRRMSFFVNGVSVPNSALDVLSTGPLQHSPQRPDPSTSTSTSTSISTSTSQLPAPPSPAAFAPSPTPPPPLAPPAPSCAPLQPPLTFSAPPPPPPPTSSVPEPSFASPPLPHPPPVLHELVDTASLSTPVHGHGTRHGAGGPKRSILSLSSRGKYEIPVRIDG
ncbi:hypothetical protein RQP46_004063 [Phenoliferia psychrophenolica]